jgi:hypothetical protein
LRLAGLKNYGQILAAFWRGREGGDGWGEVVVTYQYYKNLRLVMPKITIFHKSGHFCAKIYV